MEANNPEVISRDSKVLLAYYFLGQSYIQLGKELGISRERVRQLKDRAIKRLGVDEEVLESLNEVHRRASDIRRYGR